MTIFFSLFAALLALPVLFPHIDLLISGLFYRSGEGFFLADNLALVSIHWLAYDGARALGVAFAALAVIGALRHKPLGGINGKAGLFLLLALLIGPGLIANVGLKDHWGRARPHQIVEFGGTASFSPALFPQFDKAHSNGSFVAGDSAFGFFLPAFAFIVSRRSSKRVFWISMLGGAIFGATRIMMGAHFFSDVMYSALTMLVSTTMLHAIMYGKNETKARWRDFFRHSSV